jgi:hypothetical protein
MIEQHMDHESIDKLIKQLKKNYVPKFLKNWIKIGTINQNRISPLTDCDLKSTLSNYTEAQQFVAYGEVTLCFTSGSKFVLRVLLTDNVEKIKLRIKEQHGFANVELRLSATNTYTPSNEKDWNDGTTLKLEDTIMSSRLYENNCSIMTKIITQNVNYCLLLIFFILFCFFFK